MKKVARRLVLRAEIVRTLSATSLGHVAGASGDNRCGTVAALDSGEFQCQAPLMQTAGCVK